MTPRTTLLLVASVIVGAVSMSAGATDAFAKKRAKAVPAAAAPVIVAPDSGTPAEGIIRCFDSVIWYPAPPCY